MTINPVTNNRHTDAREGHHAREIVQRAALLHGRQGTEGHCQDDNEFFFDRRTIEQRDAQVTLYASP
jgi:hypothetical protein